MSQTYAVIAETRGGKLRQVTLEAIEAARRATQEENASIAAILIGHQVTELAEELAQYVDGPVHVVDRPELEVYHAEATFTATMNALTEINPNAVFLGHTAIGRDLAPMIAARLGAGQISDVTAIEHSGSDTIYIRPLYAGKAFERKRFVADGSAQIVTVRPNNFAVAEPLPSSSPITHSTPTTLSNLRSTVKEVVRKTSGKVDLTEAKIVVSGGRGVKSAEGFRPLERLAEVLNAAVGASRAACDAGYCDYAMQIGQTGKVVTPEIYIACGISGAIQHLAGMSQSRIIIAINKDPEAPIFKVADYGIVGDLFEVVPLLTEEFEKALA